MSESYAQMVRLLGRIEDAVEALRFDIGVVDRRDVPDVEVLDDVRFQVDDVVMFARALEDGYTRWRRSKV